MSIVGLITEYNPFHNGHKYHIEQARKLTGADTVIVIMSGNFVQRGTPAILDKFTRANMALQCGADLVIELPAYYATASAEYFALGAISILEKLQIVDSLVFGSECGNLEVLQEIARILTTEPDDYQSMLRTFLREGNTFPAARARALTNYITMNQTLSDSRFTNEELTGILNSPNNILGIEYLKALMKLNSKITPMTIQRIHADYHSTSLDHRISSATSIRHALDCNPVDLDALSTCMPTEAFEILKNSIHHSCPIRPEQINLLLRSSLLKLDVKTLSTYQDISTDLAIRILNVATQPCSYEQLVQSIKCKQYTQTRIQRALCHILLGITKEDVIDSLNNGITPYARILGFRKSKISCLRFTRNLDSLSLITKLSNASPHLLESKMMQTDLYASRLYHHMTYDAYQTVLKDEFVQSPVMLP